MSNLLVNYLNNRLNENVSLKKDAAKIPGPVITISREVGCNGVKLAHLLAERLNGDKPASPWKVISKEVFNESARELNMNPEQLQKNLQQSQKYVFEEMLKAFGDKNYKNEKTIAKTMKSVIHQIASDGYCIIVGRAGHILAGDIKNSLHIRLIASCEYRIKTIEENNGLNHAEAKAFINKVENERIAFRRSVLGDHTHEEYFDVTFNRSAFSNNEIIDIIVFAAKVKAIHQ